MTDNAEQEDRVIAEICWDEEEQMPYVAWFSDALPAPFDEEASDKQIADAVELLEVLKMDLEITKALYQAILMEGASATVH